MVDTGKAIAALEVGTTVQTLADRGAKLSVLHRQEVAGMPQTANQEVRILYARLEPGDRTPRHRHRFPVTVFVDHGVFTLHLDGQEPVRISAGEAFVEPAGVAMTGYNHDTHAPATMMLFYVCTPNAPFAEALA